MLLFLNLTSCRKGEALRAWVRTNVRMSSCLEVVPVGHNFRFLCHGCFPSTLPHLQDLIVHVICLGTTCKCTQRVLLRCLKKLVSEFCLEYPNAQLSR